MQGIFDLMSDEGILEGINHSQKLNMISRSGGIRDRWGHGKIGRHKFVARRWEENTGVCRMAAR